MRVNLYSYVVAMLVTDKRNHDRVVGFSCDMLNHSV